MIYLVRHAHAGDKHAWTRPDRQRPLSAAGWHEARGLLVRLDGHPMTGIVSSPAVRCLQTVDALAAQRALPVTTDPRLRTDAHVDDALELLFAARSGTVLCTHGEAIGAMFQALRSRGARISPDAEWLKGSTWLLDLANGHVSAATYVPPLRVPLEPLVAVMS